MWAGAGNHWRYAAENGVVINGEFGLVVAAWTDNQPGGAISLAATLPIASRIRRRPSTRLAVSGESGPFLDRNLGPGPGL